MSTSSHLTFCHLSFSLSSDTSHSSRKTPLLLTSLKVWTNIRVFRLNLGQKRCSFRSICCRSNSKSEIDKVEIVEEIERPRFDINLAVILAGFAFEAYTSPPEKVGRRETDDAGCTTVYLSESFVREIYDGQLFIKLKKGYSFPAMDPWVPSTSNDQEPIQWQKPDANNYDASVLTGEQGIGIGMVSRDELGHFIAAKTIFIRTVWPPIMAEAMAAIQAIRWSKQLGMFVICEGDSCNLIKQMGSQLEVQGCASQLIQEVCKQLQDQPNLHVKWIPRRCYEVANRLAEWARCNRCNEEWFNCPPIWLIDVLEEE